MAAVRGALIIVLVGLAAWGAYLKLPALLTTYNMSGVLPTDTITGVRITEGGRLVTYQGKTGRTALELLELAVGEVRIGPPQTPRSGPAGSVIASAGAVAQPEVLNVGGVEAAPSEHWTFAVDGFVQHSDPAAFATANGQVITWTLR